MCYMAPRDRVGVREIRQYLSVYLDRVKKGEVLEITERGQPVALLTPLPRQGSLVARLVAEGRATAPVGRLADAPPPIKLRLPKGTPTMSKILDEVRADTV
jgi:prevent-host-death family protein